MIEGYVDDEAMRAKPRYDPNKAGVALVDVGDRRQCDGRNEVSQDMTGTYQKQGRQERMQPLPRQEVLDGQLPAPARDRRGA